jgi:hypothetical protein
VGGLHHVVVEDDVRGDDLGYAISIVAVQYRVKPFENVLDCLLVHERPVRRKCCQITRLAPAI